MRLATVSRSQSEHGSSSIRNLSQPGEIRRWTASNQYIFLLFGVLILGTTVATLFALFTFLTQVL